MTAVTSEGTGLPTDAVTIRERVGASPLTDYYLVIFSVAILSVMGSLMVLSASAVIAQAKGESPYTYSMKQLAFLAVGVVAAAVVSRVPPDLIRRLGWVGWGLGVVALVLVVVGFGQNVNGNTNWVNIGGIVFQPSEFAKLALVIWAAAVFHSKRGRLDDVAQLAIPFVPGAGVVLMLILAGKDLGTGMVVGLILLSVLYFIGTSWRLLVPMILSVGAVVAILLFGSDNRMSRILIFLDPQSNTDLSSQPMAALYALASGGWWGLGLGASKQKWGGLKTGAHTDYILAVLGEELGLFGVLVVLAMFALLARAGFSIALKSDKMFNRVVSSGITAWFVIQGLINIMVVMHLLPVLGVPLPFVSYGGSSLVANLLAVGVLLACAKDTPEARVHLANRRRAPRRRMISVLAAGEQS